MPNIIFVLYLTLNINNFCYAQLAAPSFDFSDACGIAGAAGETKVNQLVTSSTGGYYVTGSFAGTVTFGSYTLTSTGQSDVFVAKVDAAGGYQWVAQAGGTATDVSNSLAVDNSGNVYITGTFKSQQVSFGSITLSHFNAGYDNTFVAKLNATGTWLWGAQSAGGYYSFGDLAVSIAVDAASNVYITGQFSSQKLQLGSITLTNSDLSLAYNQVGDPDLYVAKLSSTGTWLWAVSGGGIKVDMASGITLDPAGNVYVTGSFESTTAKFGTTTLTNSGYSNTIIAKLDGGGNWLWLARAGGSAFCYPTSIAVDGSGQTYLTGRFTSAATFGSYTVGSMGYYDIFVAKLGPTGGWQWVNQCGGTTRDEAYSIALDSQGNAYVAGAFLSPLMTVGSTTLTNSFPTEFELCVAKIDAQSNWQWATQAGGSGSDIPTSLALDSQGRIWVAGYIEGPSAQFGTITIPGNPVANRFIGFVARLNNQVLATHSPVIAPTAMTISPNPSQGTAWIHGIAFGQQVYLYDIAGRLITTGEVSTDGLIQWNLSADLPSGIYLVRNGSRVCRLIIE